jgi:ubiquinone biosynthesis protein COQ4
MTISGGSITQRTDPAPVVRQRRDWPRAAAALRRLLADKDDTVQVFEIMRSLAGPAIPKAYARLISTREGGRIAYERLELAERLMDRAWLASLPAGSVAEAYLAFTASENLSAESLAAESHRGLPDADIDLRHPYAWYGRRNRDIHDIWHVLTGYGRDAVGELCLVAFSYPQMRSLGWAFIALGGYWRAMGRGGRPYRRAVREAWRRGRAAAWLPGEDYERLLAEPLEAARRRLRLTPPTAYDAMPIEDRNPDLSVR